MKELISRRSFLKAAGVVGMAASVAAFAGCGDAGTKEVDLNALSLDEIIAQAKKEGEVHSVGMPDTWANWVGTWEDILEVYGIEHTDTDMSSAEEIAIFDAERNDPTKDIGDVGQAFGVVAVEAGVTQPYKTSYWDSIPDWAKDEDGHWIIGYYGTIAVMTNSKTVTNPPKSFADILAGDYMVNVGDVTAASQAQNAVLAAAIAFGGSESDLMPGLNYFKQIAEQGRLDKGDGSLARLEKGEIDCVFFWDYNAMNYRDQIVANNPDAAFDIMIPAEASIQSGYATIINKFAPNPHAAALAREYILSDEGQINLAIGYATPIRDVKLPDEVMAGRIPSEQYANARAIEDQAAWEASSAELGVQWQEEVVAYS